MTAGRQARDVAMQSAGFSSLDFRDRLAASLAAVERRPNRNGPGCPPRKCLSRSLRPGGRLLVSDCFFPKQDRGDRGSDATHYIFVRALGYCRLLSLAEELGLWRRL